MLDQESRDEFIEDVADEYEDIREDHYDNLKDRKYHTLSKSREMAFKVDWDQFQPKRPLFLGTKVFKDFPIEELVPYIDWKCFFDVWQLRGKYPNGRYPKIFQDATVGAEAKKVFDEAQVMLKEIIKDKSLCCNGIVGFYPANSDGDDIILHLDEVEGGKEKQKLFGLRQQAEMDGQSSCYCMSDFVAPKETGKTDYIGMFAVSTGIGCDKLCKR